MCVIFHTVSCLCVVCSAPLRPCYPRPPPVLSIFHIATGILSFVHVQLRILSASQRGAWGKLRFNKPECRGKFLRSPLTIDRCWLGHSPPPSERPAKQSGNISNISFSQLRGRGRDMLASPQIIYIVVCSVLVPIFRPLAQSAKTLFWGQSYQ